MKCEKQICQGIWPVTEELLIQSTGKTLEGQVLWRVSFVLWAGMLICHLSKYGFSTSRPLRQASEYKQFLWRESQETLRRTGGWDRYRKDSIQSILPSHLAPWVNGAQSLGKQNINQNSPLFKGTGAPKGEGTWGHLSIHQLLLATGQSGHSES